MQRKLTAILSADVVGYSGMMEADEAGTLERLKANRARIFDPHLAIHDGRLFKLMGDGALAEFASVVAAVNCALAIQAATEQAASGDAKPIRYRIGINLGEVIIEGDDIYGEGVNVAARIQALAPVGGVAVSRAVRDQVSGKASCAFEDMGEHQVKNIVAPVHVFSARTASASAGEVAPAAAKPSSDQKISICVLPFANMSGDVEQEYFSDGISEDIITDLSKVSALSVVSRNSSFMYKGKNVDLPKVARELKVSHVLEGSVRKSGGRVRITAQLIAGSSNDHVWAERYDRDLNDIFALQDEISQAIVAALKLKLLPEEKKAIETRGTGDVEAYNLYLMARQFLASGNIGDTRRAEAIMRLCRQATQIDPNYAKAWALLSLAQTQQRFLRGGEAEAGMASAERALALDPNLAEAHAARAVMLVFNAQYEAALPDVETALRLDPESYDANLIAGRVYFGLRDFEKAIRYYEKAAALDANEYTATGMLGPSYSAIGSREAAEDAARRYLPRGEKILAQDPSNGSAMSYMVYSHAVLGDRERAKQWAARSLLLDPDNNNMLYNNACALVRHLDEFDAALEILERVLRTGSGFGLEWAKTDADLDKIRDKPRFKSLIAQNERGVGVTGHDD